MEKEIWAAVIGAVGVVAAGFVTGRSFGKKGRESAFDDLETGLKLDRTKWKGTYESVGADGSICTNSGTVEFRQFGSRITGIAREGGREWRVEGLVYKGRICYVYVDQDPNVTSIGTSSFELDGSGTRLVGEWTGWGPDGRQAHPRKIVLEKFLA